jgi:hypothetical protein
MADYYGVECKTCGLTIALGQRGPADHGSTTFYAAPLDPVACSRCGSSYLYGSDDVFAFEAEDDAPIPGQP